MKKTFFISALLVITFFVSHLPAQPNDGKRNMDFRGRIEEKLNLTEDQKDKITELRLQHRKEMIDLKAELEKKELSLIELKNSKNFTGEAYLVAIENINNVKNQIALQRANHQMDVYSLLDESQKEEWLKMQNKFEHGKRFFGEHRGMRKHRNFN